MNLRHPTADVFVPDGLPVHAALQRITHLGILPGTRTGCFRKRMNVQA